MCVNITPKYYSPPPKSARILFYSIATIAAIGLAAVAYVGFILFSKTIKREDIEFLPKAKKIEKILEKRNWIG